MPACPPVGSAGAQRYAHATSSTSAHPVVRPRTQQYAWPVWVSPQAWSQPAETAANEALLLTGAGSGQEYAVSLPLPRVPYCPSPQQ